MATVTPRASRWHRAENPSAQLAVAAGNLRAAWRLGGKEAYELFAGVLARGLVARWRRLGGSSIWHRTVAFCGR